VELELRSSPLYGFALTGAYNFTDARDRKSGEKLSGGESGPRQSLKLGLNYDNDEAGLTAALIGNYVKLHDLGPSAKYDGMLWDLHVTKKLPLDMENTAELFFSLRNIFNSEQYQVEFRPNAPRWFEAGARYRF
jgi:vitamin B12 transporter